MNQIETRIEKWKQRLLDLGKRNKLINFKETKRSNLKITQPNIYELYRLLVQEERTLSFPLPMDNAENDFDDDTYDYIQSGDIQSDREISDMQKTLRNLRDNAKTSIEEQGVNVLYLVFGFILWTEEGQPDNWIKSPIVLVPVSLKLESISSPFTLSIHEDEIVINPTLAFQLKNSFGLDLPPFDTDNGNLTDYFRQVRELIIRMHWTVEEETNLSFLSFLKINMYNDLDLNKELILQNPIIRALSGCSNDLAPDGLGSASFDHDKLTRPIDTYQVVDADASQQDAILNSKKGVSFILQGPPGTGKSQTITNIIAEAMADGRKVLFVSEKMAALDVVKHRLTQVGLDQFCLTLHSHKANKKEVLSELRRSFENKPQRIRDEAIAQLNRLQSEREHINQFDQELHTPCAPLGSSIFDVYGKLAKLKETPEVIFPIANVGKIDQNRLAILENLIADLARSAGNMTEPLKSNPWRNSVVSGVSYDLRHNIEANSRILLPEIEHLNTVVQDMINMQKWPYPVSISSLAQWTHLLEIISRSPGVPDLWILSEDLNLLMEKAQTYLKDQSESRRISGKLKESYAESFFELDAKQSLKQIQDLVSSLQAEINRNTFSTVDAIYLKYGSLTNIMIELVDKLRLALLYDEQLNGLMNLGHYQTLTDITKMLNITKSLDVRITPQPCWFQKDAFRAVYQLVKTAKQNYITQSSLREKLYLVFYKDILKIDEKSVISRFHASLKIFNSAYHKDKRNIKGLCLDPSSRLNDQQIIGYLQDVRNINEANEWFLMNANRLHDFLGVLYLEDFTDWDQVLMTLDTFQTIMDNMPKSEFLPEFKNRLLNKNIDYQEIGNIKANLERLNITELLNDIQTTLYTKSSFEILSIEFLIGKIDNILVILAQLDQIDINMANQTLHTVSLSENVIALTDLTVYQRIEQSFENQHDELKRVFNEYYTDTDSDWNRVISSLSWAHEFKTCANAWDLSDTLKLQYCNSQSIREMAQKTVRDISSINFTANDTWKWFLGLFEYASPFLSVPFDQTAERVRNALNGLFYLEEWVDYQSCRTQICKNELSVCVEHFETLGLAPHLFLPAFRKQFYRLWLDTMGISHPAVAAFRRRAHEDSIKSFCELDREQLTIAKYRIVAKVNERLPSMDRMTSAKDETAILRRELQKQRKIMPLRKLFQEIPNLIMTLKPCLMMSPLSVSQYLNASTFRFDIVIFDEASQVRTEDAIGSILRGSQIIIAGDNHQMPPTNFFNATTSDEDFDEDSEDDVYNDTNAYESVLDETSTVLPRQWLRWHYRSRHEHLIAFSNAKIYNNELTTFPSSVDKAPNIGVEYIYLENGLYESGKRQNLSEAKKVVELIHDHILNRPDRSLGIIAFSQSQQAAIDMAVRQFRYAHQEFETFFNEERDEPFFIKNLENVQGDERDTIIFSIGYGKDASGKMYMRFGPLNNQGGYRRLNVAITRAKYNVKLVGSIQPTDIDLERTSAEGVKMLRSYIEYAIKGPISLAQEMTTQETVMNDSPFEETVYDFLVNRNYNVATQVGCSGYRIDMAIKHSTLSGRFVLGIECDGASYHSARTARERDRLRQEVLEKMGWKIYRIWSTDWIKDPITEGQKLIEAIQKAMSSYTDDLTATASDSGEADKSKTSNKTNEFHDTEIKKGGKYTFKDELIKNEPDKTYSEEKPVVEATDCQYRFVTYKECSVEYRGAPSVSNSEAAIYYVLNSEAPIHIDLLCQRVAPIWGYQKVTAGIQSTVFKHVRTNLSTEFFIQNNFCYFRNRPVYVRVPSGEQGKRQIKYICQEELCGAMLVVVKRSIGILRHDIFVETAHIFGFNRMGQNIEDAMEKAYEELVEIAMLIETDGKVRLGNYRK